MQKRRTNKMKFGLGIAFTTLTWLVQPVAFAQSDAELLLNVLRSCQNVEGLSARLACYDEILPPGAGTVGNVSSRVESRVPSTGSAVTPTRQAELEATVAELEQRLLEENPDEIPTARIIEVQRPTVRSSRLISADGRVFVESNSTTIVRWPDTPFDVSVSTTLTGTINITAIDENQLNRGQGRGTGRGVRVTLER